MGKNRVYYDDKVDALRYSYGYLNPPYSSGSRHYAVDWEAFEQEIARLAVEQVTAKGKMENKITTWVVRHWDGQAQSWHNDKQSAVKAAESCAARYPGTKYFVCKVEPVTMSVTNNVTTKEL